MAKFQPGYAEHQKRAVVAACVDGQLEAPAVVALAAAGELSDVDGQRIDGFPIPVSTVRKWAREERNRRQGKGAGELSKVDRPIAARAIVNRVLDILDAELRALERMPVANPKVADKRIARAGRIAREAESVLKLERNLTAPAVPAPTGQGEGERTRKAKPSKDAHDLTAEARARQRAPEHDDAPSLPPTPTGGEAPGPGELAEPTDGDGANTAAHAETEA